MTDLFEDPMMPDWHTPDLLPTLLPKKDVHVWRIDLTSFFDLDALSSTSLSDSEKQSALKFKGAALARRYSIAHEALREILSGYLSIKPKDIVFEIGPHGKPATHQGAIEFNLSHSEKRAVVAVSGCDLGCLGVDVESLARHCDALMLAKRFFSDQEYQALCALPSDRCSHGFLSMWTLKEAWVKALGVGLSDSFDRFVVSLRNREQGFVRCDSSLSEQCSWQLQRFWVDEGHVGALATLYPSDFIKYFNFCDAGVVVESRI